MLIIREKKNLVSEEGVTQGLDYTKLTSEKLFSINFTKSNKNCLSLYYNGADSYSFVNGTEIIKFKAKDSEILAYSLCL